MTPETYCQEKAAPPGSNLYYSALFHPRQQRRQIFALFAFQQALIDTVIECQDPGVARIKLHWWSEEIERLFANEARHPVSKELHFLLADLSLEKSSLSSLINTIAARVNPAQSETLTQLVDDKTREVSITWRLAAKACGCNETELIEHAVKIGGLVCCVEFFKMARHHLNRGYSPFPRSEMDSLGLNDNDLISGNNADAIDRLRNELFSSINASLEPHVVTLKMGNQSSVLFALIMALIAQANCSLLQKQAAVLSTQDLGVTPLRKLWIAWRAK
jgi:phytoene synthase